MADQNRNQSNPQQPNRGQQSPNPRREDEGRMHTGGTNRPGDAMREEDREGVSTSREPSSVAHDRSRRDDDFSSEREADKLDREALATGDGIVDDDQENIDRRQRSDR